MTDRRRGLWRACGRRLFIVRCALGDKAGTPAIYVLSSNRWRSEARIAHMARHDALTDLPNRLLFLEKMEEALGRLATAGTRFAICSAGPARPGRGAALDAADLGRA
jgi:hypothetical protein